MAKQNSINLATQDLTVDPGASGDSYLQFDIGAGNKFRIGIDDDDADAFKVSIGTLGTTDAFIMSSSGENTLPLQPMFLAYLSATATNVTGDGTSYSLVANTEVIDRTSDYDNTTGVFTASITGKFVLNGNAHLVVDATGGDEMYSSIVTSNRTYWGSNYPTKNRLANFYALNSAITLSAATLADMDAADTASLVVYSGSNAKADDVYGGDCYSWFSGYLAL